MHTVIFQLDTRQSSSLQGIDFETEYLELCVKLKQLNFIKPSNIILSPLEQNQRFATLCGKRTVRLNHCNECNDLNQLKEVLVEALISLVNRMTIDQ
ncbi:hypothetical protein T07_1567 [Trichinella nelsoni]|uniref:Uncharacterized protein n=1 Tax=Trichinella nelsoni TaxID=6336 RepID=A0A0V0SJE8_9BILA|nr:hypothetical protein T07_1567 [Trichinella nelsoni]